MTFEFRIIVGTWNGDILKDGIWSQENKNSISPGNENWSSKSSFPFSKQLIMKEHFFFVDQISYFPAIISSFAAISWVSLNFNCCKTFQSQYTTWIVWFFLDTQSESPNCVPVELGKIFFFLFFQNLQVQNPGDSTTFLDLKSRFVGG